MQAFTCRAKSSCDSAISVRNTCKNNRHRSLRPGSRYYPATANRGSRIVSPSPDYTLGLVLDSEIGAARSLAVSGNARDLFHLENIDKTERFTTFVPVGKEIYVIIERG